jgi:hypothetical protein
VKYVIGLFMGLAIGCATTISGQLRFQDRELLIHPDLPVLSYPHRITVCEQRTGLGRVLGQRCRSEQRMDNYDLSDSQVRKSLIDAGFSCKSAMRFKY